MVLMSRYAGIFPPGGRQRKKKVRELLYPRVEEKGNMVVIVRVFREPKEKRYQKAI